MRDVLEVVVQRIDGIDFGTLPEWIAAVGTVLAFGLALRIYKRDSEYRRSAQPRLVHAQLDRSIRWEQAGTTFIELDPDGFFWDCVSHTVDRTATTMNEPFGMATISVHNNSDEAIFDVSALVSYQGYFPIKDDRDHTKVMSPKTSATVTILFEQGRLEQNDIDFAAGVVFTDAVGTRWKRMQGESVQLAQGPVLLPELPLN